MTDAPEMPEKIWVWHFIPSKQNDVIKGGWDDSLDRKSTEYIRSDLAPTWRPIDANAKTGETFLLYCERPWNPELGPFQITGYWDQGSEKFNIPGGWRSTCHSELTPPRLYMPLDALPQPPAKE